MAYGNMFPMGYPQYYSQQQAQTPQPTQQMQSGGFLPAPNEAYVMSYPVGLGNCVTFKIEGKPIVMEKSMGFSQLDAPKIDRYRLVKEEVEEPVNQPEKEEIDLDTIKLSIDKANEQIEAIWAEINEIKSNDKSKNITKASGSKRNRDTNDSGGDGGDE